MAAACRRVAESGAFQGLILTLIGLNAVVLGVQTYDIADSLDSTLSTVDDVILGIFAVEIAIRVGAFGRRPQDFFRNGWNLFDFAVVGAAFLPILRGDTTLLRIVRLLRVVRLVTVLPDLRVLLRALARSIPPILSLLVLTLMLMYIYGMVGWILFADEDPENWGDIGQALLSTFTMLTLENWPALLDAGTAIHPWSWVYFVSYVLLASFIVINILIAIIINSMEEVHEAERVQHLAHLDEADRAGDVTIADRLSHLREVLDELERDLESGGTHRAPRLGSRRPTKGGRMRA